MNILNAQVLHNKYGVGFVIDQNETIITVRFGGDYGTKKFLYPSIFENYLSLCSQTLQSEQMEEILRRQAEYKAAMAIKAAEEDKRVQEKKSPLKALNKKYSRKIKPSTAAKKAAKQP
jgi:hypothetical protein